jgi:hypothetical protein
LRFFPHPTHTYKEWTMTSVSNLRVLLVGIDEYKSSSVPNLRGCVADVKAMFAFLTTRLGVPADNIKLLTSAGGEAADQVASRKNILATWQDLVDRVGTGDQIFFHYSGHGAQANSIDPNEPDGYDETLVPYDSRDVDDTGAPVYDILDKEVAALIDMAEKKGAVVTIFLDCCHSGSGTREAAAPDESKPLTRRGPRDERVRPADTLVPGTRLTEVVDIPAEARSTSGWQSRSDTQHVLLAGCRDEELSHEYRSPETGDWQGATTYFLLKILRDYYPELTWRQVHDRVQTYVNSIYNRQSPQLEGPGNRQIFGGIAAPETPHLLVIEAEVDGNDSYVKINGGAAVGLTEGSQVAVYPAGGDDMSSQPLAKGTVIQTKLDHVWAQLDAAIDPAHLPFRVRVTAKGYDNLVYTVDVDDPSVVDALKSATEPSPFLQIAETEEDRRSAHFRVVTHNEEYVIQDGVGVQIVSKGQPHTPEGAAQIAQNLAHLAIYNNVRNLRNPTPSPAMEKAITVEALSYTRSGFTGPKDGIPLSATGDMLAPGRKIWLKFRNDSEEDLYVTVFNLSANYGIARLYPRQAVNQKIAPGREDFIPGLAPQINNPFATQSREIFKIFATKIPMSFDVLELTELNEPDTRGGTRAEGPLSQLLNGIRREGTRKMVITQDDTAESWITKQVEFMV